MGARARAQDLFRVRRTVGMGQRLDAARLQPARSSGAQRLSAGGVLAEQRVGRRSRRRACQRKRKVLSARDRSLRPPRRSSHRLDGGVHPHAAALLRRSCVPEADGGHGVCRRREPDGLAHFHLVAEKIRHSRERVFRRFAHQPQRHLAQGRRWVREIPRSLPVAPATR